jgi:hypothetical protein
LNQQVEGGKRLSSGTRASGMAETIARRYSIEIKDAKTGNSLILIAAMDHRAKGQTSVGRELSCHPSGCPLHKATLSCDRFADPTKANGM